MINPTHASDLIARYAKQVSIIPVLVIDEVKIAGELAKVLVDAGLPLLEVTLRTPSALQVMEQMARIEGATVAAGTVLNQQQLQDAQSAGAQFAVSPGYTESLIDAASQADMPLLPGAATAAEVMQLAEKGFHYLKFFPAEINGGVAALKALSAPLPQVRFCPTGGVNTDNLQDYLSLLNVEVVGGSWLVTQADIRERNWESIANKARAVSAVVRKS